jgi:hypothetical protein
MNIRQTSLALAAICLVSSMSFAASSAQKTCNKQAKTDYDTAVKACKDKKGAEAKSCKKDAKAAYTSAKEACKNPAPAPEAAPSGSAQ